MGEIAKNARVTLHIDNREHAVKDHPQYQDITTQWENLPMGDFVIKVDNVECLVIERKTLPDLAASLKDGRYKNQKARMLDTFGNQRIAYVFERFDGIHLRPPNNDNSNTKVCVSGIATDALVSAVINTSVRDHIQCYHTSNINETINLVKNIFKRIEKNPEKYVSSNTILNTTLNTTPNTQPVKLKNSTPHDCYIAQLCQIPGVSLKTAESIASIYPSFRSLIDNFDINTYIKVADLSGTGKSRAISKNIMRALNDIATV